MITVLARLFPFKSNSSALTSTTQAIAELSKADMMRWHYGAVRCAHQLVAGHGRLSNQRLPGFVSSACKQRSFSQICNFVYHNHFLKKNINYSIRQNHTFSRSTSRSKSPCNRKTLSCSPHVETRAAYAIQTGNASHSCHLHNSYSTLLDRHRRWSRGGSNMGSVRSCMAATNVNAAGKVLKDNTPAPKSAAVVVVGGGSLGCSALYHLAKLGVTDTVLVEANKLTAGTTWHTAGLIRRLRPNDTDVALVNSTYDVITRLEGETGVDPGWINNGGLYIASCKERLDEYKRMMTLGRALGVASHVLTPQETKDLYPLMNVSDVLGSLYVPGSGTVNPAGLCDALTRGPKRTGATILENCAITGIKTSKTVLGGRKVTQVKTPRGNINTNCVINATGAWANQVTSLVGLSVPLVAMKHAYVVTEKIPGIENMPNIRDLDSLVYLRLQGDALSIGGFEKNPHFIPKISLEFAFGLYDLDYDVFNSLMKGHINRLPVLETTGIKSTICGPESFTPDHKPIMGEDPEVEGFFHCCGFNSAGIMLGGGCGEQIAKWVVNGRPELDMFSYDIRRFHTPLLRDQSWVKQRSHEAYATSYSIVFPHDEPLAGRGKRKSPLHNALERAGCVFQERHGWERPGWFNAEPAPVQKYDWYGCYNHANNEDQRYVEALRQDYSFDFPQTHDKIKKECLACRNDVVGFDMSYFGKFYLTGPDASEAADHLFSADTRRPEGSIVYTCMLNERGGTEADLTVSVLLRGRGFSADPRFYGTGYYLTVGGAAALQNYAHIIKEIRKNKWDVQLFDHTEDLALLSVQGPKSRDLLASLTSADLSNEAFPFSTHQVIEVAGQKVRALRVSFVGEMGWELHIPRRSSLSVYKAVVENGKQFGFQNSGYRAMDSLSCEKGNRHWHADVRPDDTPLEAGLGFTCKLKTDIPFLGRRALEMQKAEGLKRKLVTLTLDDPNKAIWGQEAIKRDGKYVGFVRRAEFGFTLMSSIAYGYVERPDKGVITKDFLTNGSWSVESLGEDIPAKLHTTHPFDPKNERIKGLY